MVYNLSEGKKVSHIEVFYTLGLAFTPDEILGALEKNEFELVFRSDKPKNAYMKATFSTAEYYEKEFGRPVPILIMIDGVGLVSLMKMCCDRDIHRDFCTDVVTALASITFSADFTNKISKAALDFSLGH